MQTLQTDTQSLASRHKTYEKEYEIVIPHDKFIIVRIDGHKFSKFTKGFDKPFDTFLSETMEETTKILVEEFNAVTGYTQSDEITLIIQPSFHEKISKNELTFQEVENEDIIFAISKIDNKEYQISPIIDESDCLVGFNVTLIEDKSERFIDSEISLINEFKFHKMEIINNQLLAGRTQKMVSLISAKTTQTFNKIFNKKLMKLLTSKVYVENKVNTIKRIQFLMKKNGEAWFDARVYGVSTPEETFNSVMWRVRDAMKNSKAMFAQAYCSHKSLLKKNSDEQIQFCLETTGKDWNSIDNKFKYGVIIKRESYEKEVPEEFKGKSEKETTIRTRVVSFSLPMTTFTSEDVEMINRKYK
jgi:tRNA(His) 5'-end guanylyltransferase